MKKLKRWLGKYINGTRGVISIFLAILMVPFVSIAGALISAGRVNSSIALFDEALCNASNSTLGTYDDFLRKRFGLMAVSQDTVNGASKLGVSTVGYTSQDFLNDTFQFYMQQNTEILSNTYETEDVSAVGLYPLADRSVLLSSVLQAGEYTVPAKLAVDWLSIDDMLKDLTKGLSMLTSWGTVLTDGTKTVDSIVQFSDDGEDLKTKLDDCVTKKGTYDEKFTAFKNAVNNYNAQVQAISDYQSQMNTAQSNMNTAQSNMNTAQSNMTAANNAMGQNGTQRQNLQDQIDDLEKAQEDDDTIDNSAAIQDLQDQITELDTQNSGSSAAYDQAQQDYNTAQQAYNTAQQDYNKASQNLQNTRNNLPSYRSAVETAIDEYDTAICSLRDAFDSAYSAVNTFITDFQSIVSNAESISTDGVSAAYETAKSGIQSDIDDAKEQQKGTTGDTYTSYQNQIDDLTAQKNTVADVSTLTSAKDKAKSSLETDINKWVSDGTKQTFRNTYNALDVLAGKVENLTVPSGEEKFSITVSDYYIEVTMALTSDNVETIISNYANQITSNVGWDVIKAVLKFIDAISNISFDFSLQLMTDLNTGYYSSNGGLPSEIDRTSHPLTSAYESEDAATSAYYKQVLNSYCETDVYSDTGDMGNLFDDIMKDIDTILGIMDDFKLKRLKELFDTVKHLISTICSCQLSTLAQDMMTSSFFWNKLLLVGYISYNTANRTTYTGSALTGASYSLPDMSHNPGYLFSGAETEYIINGSTSEVDNQASVTSTIMFARILYDFIPVACDSTVQGIMDAVSAVPYIGILLAIIVYVVWVIAEATVDTIILVSGQTVPIVKTTAYLSPTGIPKLLEKLINFTLSEATKEDIYNECCDTVKEVDEDATYPKYSDAKSSTSVSVQDSLEKVFNLDYTKMLQIIMLLTKSNYTMLNRLADVIEMESAYNAADGAKGLGTYMFNLDYSYTYIRASGSFTSNLFMKISDTTGITSTERVFYKGY